MKKIIYIIGIFFAALNLNAQPGSLDLSFGAGGLVTTPMGNAVDKAYSIAIQADGKIIVAGTDIVTGVQNDFALARYNSDGTLDNTFGTGGKVTTDIGTGDDEAYSVTLQADGKIVAVGYVDICVPGGCFDFAVVRYNSNGSLDNSFGSNGIVTTHFGSLGAGAFARSVSIQLDQKIVVAGYGNAVSGDFYLARYNSDGSLDNTFGSGGIVTTDFANYTDFCFAASIQIDGKIVAVGSSLSSATGQPDFALARYNTDGSLDVTFGIGGLVTTSFGIDAADYAFSSAIQSNGKIIAGGTTYGSPSDFALARYNRDGSLDSTFGIGGRVTTDFANSIDYGRTVAIQADGKIVMAGNTPYALNDFAVVRYNSDGSLDSTFGSGGKVNTDFASSSDDVANAAAIQSNGKIVIAGYSWGDFAIARYEANSSLGVSAVEDLQSTFIVSPNPFSTMATLRTTIPLKNASLTIYNSLGQEVKQIKNISGETFTLPRENLKSGVYFISISQDHKKLTAKKLIIADQ